MNEVTNPNLQSAKLRAFDVESKATATQQQPIADNKAPKLAEIQAELAVRSTKRKAAEESIKASQENVKAAIEEMSQYTQSIQRDIQFAIDDELGRTVVSVVDRETQQVIRQIPDETFLQLARTMKENLAAGEDNAFHFMSTKV